MATTTTTLSRTSKRIRREWTLCAPLLYLSDLKTRHYHFVSKSGYLSFICGIICGNYCLVFRCNSRINGNIVRKTVKTSLNNRLDPKHRFPFLSPDIQFYYLRHKLYIFLNWIKNFEFRNSLNELSVGPLSGALHLWRKRCIFFSWIES